MRPRGSSNHIANGREWHAVFGRATGDDSGPSFVHEHTRTSLGHRLDSTSLCTTRARCSLEGTKLCVFLLCLQVWATSGMVARL